MRNHLAIAIALALTAAGSPAQSQSGVDPIGKVTKVSTFDRAQRVDVGKSSKGKPVCYFREEGGSHMLDLGMSAHGAFIHVAYGDGPLPLEAVPVPPLSLSAGKALTKVVDGDVKDTGEYQPYFTYRGAIDYVPNLVTEYGNGFVVVGKGDPESFFETVARARGEFIVIQSASEPKRSDVVAIYKFTAKSIPALLACAKKNVR